MAKVKWGGDSASITADDINEAADGFEAYAGPLPPGGVYRFKMKRIKYTEFSTGSQGFNILWELDGSWKEEHAEYNGAPLWDRVVMTKAAAAFVKAFAIAIGVTSEDLISRVVVDDDNNVTKIGNKLIKGGESVYVAVRRRNDTEREPSIEKSSTGYQMIEESGAKTTTARKSTPAKATATKATPAKAAAKATTARAKAKEAEEVDEEEADEPEPPKSSKGKAGKGKAGKPAGKAGKNKGKSDDDEPPF